MGPRRILRPALMPPLPFGAMKPVSYPTRSPRVPLLATLLLAAAAGAVRADILRVPQEHATIQAAVDAAQPGDEIRIAKGTYAESVLIAGKSDLLLRGGGATLDGGGDDLALTITGSSHIVVDGLRLVSTPEWPVVDIMSSTDIAFRRVRFRDCNYGIYGGNVTGLEVDRCRFDDMTGPLLLLENAVDIDFTRSRARNVWAVIDGSGVSDVLLDRITARGIEEVAVDLDDADDVIIQDVRLRDAIDHGISIQGDRVTVTDVAVLAGRDLGIDIFGDDAVVQRVRIAVEGEEGLGVTGANMLVETVRILRPFGGCQFRGTGGTVRDVRVLRPGGFGMILDDFSGGLVEDCRVTRPGEEGFLVRDDCARTTLRGNAVLGSTSENEEAAFDVRADSGVTLVDNLSRGANVSGFLVDGTGHTFTDNRSLGSGVHGFHVLSGGHLFEGNRAAKSTLFDLFDEQEAGANTYVANDFGTTSFGEEDS